MYNFFENALDLMSFFTFLSIKTKWKKSHLLDPLLIPHIYPFSRRRFKGISIWKAKTCLSSFR